MDVYNLLMMVFPLLCIGKVVSATLNETTDANDPGSNPDTLTLDLTYQLYEEPNSNITFNTSVFAITTITTPKRRRNIKFRRPRRKLPKGFLDTLDQFVVPVALCLGILGNLVIFPTFVYTPVKANALSHYLAAVSVSDLMYLVSCLIFWSQTQGLTFYHTVGVCQLTQFFLRISRFLTTWYLFAAHVQRFSVHFQSFCARTWCTTFRSKFIIIFIFIFSVVGYLHYIWTNVVEEFRGRMLCMIMSESMKHIKELAKIEAIAAFFLPMLLMIVIDVALCIHTIAKRYKLYFRVPSKSGSVKSDPGNDDLGDYVLTSRHRSGSQPNRSDESSPPPPKFDLNLERKSATLAVVICGIMFIALILPSSAVSAKMFFFPKMVPTRNEVWAVRIFEQLVKVNAVYKFLLYFIVLKPFRKGLVYLFKCQGRKKRDENQLQETTEV